MDENTAIIYINSLKEQLSIAKNDAESYRIEANNNLQLSQKNLDKYFELKEALEKIVLMHCHSMYTCSKCERNFSFSFKCKGTVAVEIAKKALGGKG